MQTTTTTQKKSSDSAPTKGLSGSTIKLIAMAIMLLDHIGGIILERILIARGINEVTEATASAFLEQNQILYWTDFVLRNVIGRVAFPLFLFLLFEGFRHTHDRKRYAFNLAVLALISEIPYNLSMSGQFFCWERQSIGITLLLCLLLLCLMDYIDQKLDSQITITVLQLLTTVAFSFVSFFIRGEYGASGILAMAVIYFFRKTRMMSMVTGCLALSTLSTTEITSFLCLIPIHYYNGERGISKKYIFYAFYPVHLLVLYGIACLMGYGAVSLIV